MYAYQSVIDAVTQKKIHPIYFLCGTETFFIDAIADAIENNIISESSKGFDLSIVYGRDINANQLRDICMRYPMLEPYQIIVVKEAQLIKEWDAMYSYFESPMPTTILALCYKNTIDKRTSFYKKITQHTFVFNADPIKDYELTKWITYYCEGIGLHIDPAAAVLIVEHIGNNLSAMVNELSKIQLNMGDNKKITATEIERFIGVSKEYNAFELQKALSKRDAVKCIKIAEIMSAHDKNAAFFTTTNSLFSYFTKLYSLHVHKPSEKNSIANLLGVNPFFVDDYLIAARAFPLHKTERILQMINKYDLKAKGVNNHSTTQNELLKELIIKILII